MQMYPGRGARLLRDIEDVAHRHVPLHEVAAPLVLFVRLELDEAHKDVDWHEPHGLLHLEGGGDELVGCFPSG